MAMHQPEDAKRALRNHLRLRCALGSWHDPIQTALSDRIEIATALARAGGGSLVEERLVPFHRPLGFQQDPGEHRGNRLCRCLAC